VLQLGLSSLLPYRAKKFAATQICLAKLGRIRTRSTEAPADLAMLRDEVTIAQRERACGSLIARTRRMHPSWKRSLPDRCRGVDALLIEVQVSAAGVEALDRAEQIEDTAVFNRWIN
jgi:hypothetical protein